MKHIFVVSFMSFNLAAAAFFNAEGNENGIVLSAPQELSKDFLIGPEAMESFLYQINENMFDFMQNGWELFDEFRNSQNKLNRPIANSSRSKLYKNIHALMKKGPTQHPLFLCSECGSHNKKNGPSSSTCPLQRIENKAQCPRELFLQNILENIGNGPEKGVIFYASGGSLFEIQVLSAFLTKGALFDRVIFIDPEYNFTLEDMMLFKSIFASPKFPGSAFDVNKLRRIYRTIQIAYFLWSRNPDIKIHFYTAHTKYIADVNKNSNFRADALIAMDPIDNLYNSSTGEFIVAPLMKKELQTLKKNLLENGLFAINYRSSGLDLSTEMEIVEHHRQCGTCGSAQAPSTCSQCRSEFYCTRDCQTSHWPIHKTSCFKL